MKRLGLILASVAFVSLWSCQPPEVIRSAWTDSPVSFEANSDTWRGVMQTPDDPQFGIGVKNNGKYLYLCIISWKREINRRILKYGATTWFTSKSKKGKRFGIRFPLGTQEFSTGSPQTRKRERDPDAMRAMLMESFQELEFLGPDKTDTIPVKAAVAESFGIVVRAFPSEEKIAYLLQVPLNPDSANRYALNIGKDSVVSVSFETTVPGVTAAASSETGAGGTHAPSLGQGGGEQNPGAMQGAATEHRPTGDEMDEPFSAGFTIALSRRPAK